MEKRSWDLIGKEKLSDKINRQMIWGKKLMAVRIEIAPNSSIPVHEHESEQFTTVHKGQITLHFPGHGDITLLPDEMLLIPSMVPHSVSSGPEGCEAVDFFSPIRQDFIDGSAGYMSDQPKTTDEQKLDVELAKDTASSDPYSELQVFLAVVGIRVPVEKLQEYPLETLARYAYEKQCVTMGQLRNILKIDKKQAKDMLRTWKHGDDHSESSYKRSLERVVIIPAVFQKTGQAPGAEHKAPKEKDGRKEDS